MSVLVQAEELPPLAHHPLAGCSRIALAQARMVGAEARRDQYFHRLV